MKNFLTRVSSSLKQRGAVRTARRCRRTFATACREWRLGIRTGGSISADELEFDETSFGYQPIPYESLDAALQHIPLKPQRDVFLDYGCGMGRAVIDAARRPFRRVIGVERSPELCSIATANIQRARYKLVCESVSVETADARTYEVPDDVTVVFMFNPFDAPIVRVVLDKLHRSLQRAPRDLRIIYGLPNCRQDALAVTAWLEPWKEIETIDSDWQRLVIYKPSFTDESRHADRT